MYCVSIVFLLCFYCVSIELYKHEWGVSTAFPNSPKLSRVFIWLDRNMEYMFSISFRKHRNKKKENNFVTLIIKM